jgi:hypothetical protein
LAVKSEFTVKGALTALALAVKSEFTVKGGGSTDAAAMKWLHMGRGKISLQLGQMGVLIVCRSFCPSAKYLA